MRLTTDEKHLAAAHRAALEYLAARVEGRRHVVEPDHGELVFLEVHLDLSGTLVVMPSDPNSARFTAASWVSIEEAAEKIASATMAKRQEAQERASGRRVGDPRRGRKRENVDCDSEQY